VCQCATCLRFFWQYLPASKKPPDVRAMVFFPGTVWNPSVPHVSPWTFSCAKVCVFVGSATLNALSPFLFFVELVLCSFLARTPLIPSLCDERCWHVRSRLFLALFFHPSTQTSQGTASTGSHRSSSLPFRNSPLSPQAYIFPAFAELFSRFPVSFPTCFFEQWTRNCGRVFCSLKTVVSL